MKINKDQKGFTIIEVVLVLAIAGLIFMMVFIALPSLQRSQRDQQRKSDLSRLLNSLTSYTSNNRGALPNGFTGNNTDSWPSFLNRYVLVGGDTFNDPTGGAYSLSDTGGAGVSESVIKGGFNSENTLIYVTIGSICNGETLTNKQGTRKVAFQMILEGSGVACVNN